MMTIYLYFTLHVCMFVSTHVFMCAWYTCMVDLYLYYWQCWMRFVSNFFIIYNCTFLFYYEIVEILLQFWIMQNCIYLIPSQYNKIIELHELLELIWIRNPLLTWLVLSTWFHFLIMFLFPTTLPGSWLHHNFK